MRDLCQPNGIMGTGQVVDHFLGSINLGFTEGNNALRIYGRGFERAHEYQTVPDEAPE
jgi:hypothetical protein